MIIFFVFLSALLVLCRKYKLYVFAILPIFLLINYVITCALCYSEFFFDSKYYFTIFNLAGFGEFESVGLNFSLINKIFISISFLWLQILLFTIILKSNKDIKNLSRNILDLVDQFFESRSSKWNVLKYLEYFLTSLILIHAFSFYLSDYAFLHNIYLFSKKQEFYYFYPFISSQIAKLFPIIIHLLLGIKIIKNNLNIFNTRLSILIYLHGYIWFSSTNSRWTSIWIISLSLYTVISLIKSKIKRPLKLTYTFFIASFSLYLSIFNFGKVLFFRNQVSGIGTIFLYGANEFNFLETLKGFVILNFSSPILIYSGIEQNLQTSLFYDLVALSPLPSFLHGLNSNYFNTIVSRVTVYVPSSSYLQIYQNNFIYSLVVSFLFAIILSIILCLKESIIKLPSSSSKLVLIPALFEILLVIPLLYGFQYQVRSIMRYYWITFILIIIIPIFLRPFIKKEIK